LSGLAAPPTPDPVPVPTPDPVPAPTPDPVNQPPAPDPVLGRNPPTSSPGHGGGTIIAPAPASDSSRASGFALLGQTMASTFVTAGEGHDGPPITDQPSNQPPLLTHPHA